MLARTKNETHRDENKTKNNYYTFTQRRRFFMAADLLPMAQTGGGLQPRT
jgi:hypothetical protein